MWQAATIWHPAAVANPSTLAITGTWDREIIWEIKGISIIHTVSYHRNFGDRDIRSAIGPNPSSLDSTLPIQTSTNFLIHGWFPFTNSIKKTKLSHSPTWDHYTVGISVVGFPQKPPLAPSSHAPNWRRDRYSGGPHSATSQPQTW